MYKCDVESKMDAGNLSGRIEQVHVFITSLQWRLCMVGCFEDD